MEVTSGAPNSVTEDESNYDKAKEVKAFDDTKTGVKGLVDSGVIKIPRFFIHPPENVQGTKPRTNIGAIIIREVPVIDFQGFESFRRKELIEEIRNASETWGIFQMVNHGIPVNILEKMLASVKEFHEQSEKVKIDWYSRDPKQRVRYFCNGDLLVSKWPANWRDTLAFEFQDGDLDSELFPEICRKVVSEYITHVIKMRKVISELISEALGLPSNYLSSIECMESESLACHYYPPCPEPDLTLGATKHTDPSFLTILLQDNKGGLQVLNQNQWINVQPLQGALVVNIGDFMQLITNDKFRSVVHRVLVGQAESRTSVACFFYPSTANKFRRYGAIKELLSHNQPIYRETHITEYMAYFKSKGLDGIFNR